MKNKYDVGCIVTFKTHPLLYDFYIKGDEKLVPPFMIVKEVYFENKSKKIVDESTGDIIAERIKYTCVYFDDNKNEFKEVIIYESMLLSYEKIHIAKVDGSGKETEGVNYISLIDEVNNYKKPTYKFGNIIYFRTKKFEIFKKRISKVSVKEEKDKGVFKTKETKQFVVNYSTPEFIICGSIMNEEKSLFYPNGDRKKIISEYLFKVKWFNSSQMKFSEVYLPIECFTDKQPFETKVPHNLD
jgi:hypothetical protein